MTQLLYVLIVAFTILLVYQWATSNVKPSIVEGLENENGNGQSTATSEYQPYNVSNPNNSLILAQQNAGNIEVLKEKIDALNGVNAKVDRMQENIDLMQSQINGLVQQQSEYGQQLAGSTPPTITGTEPETVDDVTKQ